MENILVFPTAFHLEYIEKHQRTFQSNITIVYSGDKPHLNSEISLINENEFNLWSRGKKLRFLPCSEAALYFMWREKHFSNEFSRKCYELFLKTRLQETLIEAGIPHIKKQILEKLELYTTLSFPFIVKPNFGFGSQMVEQIKTVAKLDIYTKKFEEQYSQNIIESFRRKYLANLNEGDCKQILIEQDRSDLLFVSVPFVVRDGIVSRFFPCVGTGTLMSSDHTDRRVVFNYPCQSGTVNADLIRIALEKLLQFFRLKNGVFHSEFLCDDKEAYLVEFSPRMTGESISRLISFSEGIDLAGISIALFLNENIPTDYPKPDGELELLRIFTSSLSTYSLPLEQKRVLNQVKTKSESVSVDIISII